LGDKERSSSSLFLYDPLPIGDSFPLPPQPGVVMKIIVKRRLVIVIVKKFMIKVKPKATGGREK